MFPEIERVKYAIAPLTEVICQVHFPPILKINTDPPADFQEAIRNDYPFYEAVRTTIQGQGLPPQLAGMIPSDALFGTTITHQFRTQDHTWSVTLSQDSLALSTTQYIRWKDFRDRLEVLLEILRRVYRPHVYIRLGLRYQDLIRRSAIGLSDAPWSELLQPHIAGVLADPFVGENVTFSASQAVIGMPEIDASVRIQYGLAVMPSPDKAGEICFVIDSDMFRDGRTENNDVLTTLDSFNRESYRLFRWCVTDRVHNAMGPEPMVSARPM